MENKVLNTKEVAKFLNCSYSVANRLMHSDRLYTFDLASRYAKKRNLRTTVAALQDFIKGEGNV
jgi:hypothetical protein